MTDKDERAHRYSVNYAFRGRHKSKSTPQDSRIGVEARRAFRGRVQLEREGADAAGDEEADVQRELLDAWAARAHEPAGDAPAAQVDVRELVVGAMKERKRGACARVARARWWLIVHFTADVRAEEGEFEVLAGPSTARVLALDERGAAGPEPQEEWEYVDDEFDGAKAERKRKASYAKVVTEGMG